jgi:DNA-binding MarR family transcriptional regulator
MGDTLAYTEEKGLVERRSHPADGRQMLLSLTAEDSQTRQKITLAERGCFFKAIAKLDSAERQMLISAVELIGRVGEP